MNRITEQIERFNSLKKNLKNQDINSLTTSDKTTILNIFKRKKNTPPNSFPKLENTQKNFITYNPMQYNHEIKNKFLTKKWEPNTVKENISKEISPHDKKDKSKNILIGNYSNGIKNNHKENTINDNDSKSIISNVNLLNLENGEVKMKEVRDILQQEDRKKKELENQKMSQKNEEGKKKYNYDNEINEDLVDSDLDEFDINDEWKEKQNEKEKCKTFNNKINKERLKSNLILNKEESKINFHEKMNLFDENEIMKDSDSDFFDDKDDCKDEENNNFNKEEENNNFNKEEENNNFNKDEENNNFNKDEGNNFLNNGSQAKNINNQNSSNIYSYENNNKNNKNNYYVTPFQDKENKINENDKQNASNISNSNSLKICIPLEDNFEIFEKIKIYSPGTKKGGVGSNYLGKKTKSKDNNNQNQFKNNSNTPKSEQKINKKNLEKINKRLNKVILDEEDEEEYLNNENNNNKLLITSPKKNTESLYNNSNNSKPFISSEGNKFTLILESETKVKNSDPISKDQFNSIKNDYNKTFEPPKNISINIDNNSNKIKNNKIKINKNKNGSPYQPNKNIINKKDYDIFCINNINKVLTQIQEKISKEKINQKIIKKCFEIIENIKNTKYTDDNIQRKKNTYIGIIRVVQILLFQLSENKIGDKNIEEVFQILEYTINYFKNVKTYNDSINNNKFYYKRKIAFKYVVSKLELKNFGTDSLKGLTNNNANINNNNKLLKFAKLYKRYTKTSGILLEKIKDFIQKLNSSTLKLTINLKSKYATCPSNIQMAPHLISYNSLFKHFSVVLSFYRDFSKLNKSEEELKKKGTPQKKDKINIDKNKGKSNGIKQNEYTDKNKERNKSTDRIKEKENHKEKNNKYN